MPVRVYYEDTDFSGIVYHASYLRFMERGRTNYLRLLGADHRALFEETEREAPGFAFVVRSMPIEFLKPARMDDVLAVVTEPAGGEGRLDDCCAGGRARRRVLVEAQVRVAFVSGGRARPIPKPLRIAMQADQGPRRTAHDPQAHRRGGTGDVKALHMSWNRDDGPPQRGYHHGNLKEALMRAALELIAQKGPSGFTFAEAARWAGVSPAAPYRHFRDRDELLANVALRGFEQFEAALGARLGRRPTRRIAAFERLGRAYLDFARDRAGLLFGDVRGRGAARRQPGAARGRRSRLCGAARRGRTVGSRWPAGQRPPALMMALHIWALSHGIASLFGRGDAARRSLPMSPEELLDVRIQTTVDAKAKIVVVALVRQLLYSLVVIQVNHRHGNCNECICRDFIPQPYWPRPSRRDVSSDSAAAVRECGELRRGRRGRARNASGRHQAERNTRRGHAAGLRAFPIISTRRASKQDSM